MPSRQLLLALAGSGAGLPATHARELNDPSAVGWVVPQDPKAVHGGGKTFVTWTGSNGDDYVMSIDDVTGVTSTPFALHGSNLESGSPDPHDNPAILVRNDGRLMLCYSPHANANVYLRVSTNPYDATAFGAEVNLASQLGAGVYTYMGLAQVSAETNTVHLFCRNGTYVGWSKSTDNGATWSALTSIFQPDGGGQRSYRRMGSNGVDRIDIICTNKDPDPSAPAAIYHLFYDAGDGDWHSSDGTVLTLPADKTTTTLVEPSSSGSAWSNGITYDGAGNPISVIQRQHATTVDVHQRRWNGASWDGFTVVDGLAAYDSNAYLPAAPDASNPDQMVVSVKVGSHWEIFLYTTSNGGASWTGRALTSGSAEDHTQPDFVWNPDPRLRFVWLYGNGGTLANGYNDGNFAVWGA